MWDWRSWLSARKSSLKLLNFPDVVLRRLLTEWLGLRDVVRLDSAFCCRASYVRYSLLAYDKHTALTVDKNDSNSKFSLAMNWASRRNAHLDGIYVDEVTNVKSLSKFLATSGNAVRWVACSCKNDTADYNILMQQLAEISLRCPKVRWLRLDCLRSDVLWDNSLVTLTQSFQMLTELTLSKVVNLSAGGLIVALSHCKCLESLHIKTRNQRIPVEVAIPSLKSITIMSVHMHDAVLLAIGQKCSKLETLLFFQWKAGDGDLVTDLGGRGGVVGCPLLRETDVEYAANISPELRVELAKRRDSTRIDFVQWIGMTDELAQGLLTVCPNLTELHCTFCAWLTDATLLVCAQHCPPLKVFTFWKCPLVTVDGVRAVVAKAADRLRTVEMRFIPETLADEATMAIAEHCPLLERFDAEPMVSNAAAARLAKRCVRLQRKPTGRTTGLLVKLRPWILRVLFLIALAVVSQRERCEHLIVAMMPAWYMIQ
jgi:hypothetical protein